MFKDIIEYFGISRDSFYLLVVTGIGSLSTAIAAFAAWSAAKATAASVGELKEARLQAMRPTLIASVGPVDDFTLLWPNDQSPRFIQGNAFSVSDGQSTPLFSLINVGTGAAVNIILEWQRAKRAPFSDAQVETIRTFFARGSCIVEARSYGIDVTDTTGRTIWMSAGEASGTYSRFKHELCEAGQQVARELLRDTVLSLLAEVIAGQGLYGGTLFTATDRLTVSYASITGEKFNQSYDLTISGSYAQPTMDDHGSRGEQNWNLLRSHFGISLRRYEPDRQSWLAYFGIVQRR